MEKEKEKEKILYQLYEPELKECETVKLKVGIGSNIPWSWWKKYSVTVCYYGSGRKQEHMTSKKMPWSAPNWDETFTFHIVMKNAPSKYLECKFAFMLKVIPRLGAAYDIATTVCTLKEIQENRNEVNFKGGITINVKLTEHIKRNPDVRKRDQFTLCQEETVFRGKRSSFVLKNMINGKVLKEGIKEELKKHEKGIKEESKKHEMVPTIAVIGSGGGMRAVQGMCGAMIALEKKQILDLAMYTAGVSGSSWYISTLYAHDPKADKLCPEAVMKSIKNNVVSLFTEGVSLLDSLKTTVKRQFYHKGKYRTFTNFFGNAIGYVLLGQNRNSTWSSQTTKLKGGKVPLPLLAMLHVFDKENPEALNEWIECSPFEAFMPKYCTSIDMKHFGSEFDGGFIRKEYPEEPVHFLQGICGSAYISVFKPKPKESGRYCCFLKKQWGYILDSYLMESMESKCVGEVPNWLYGVSAITKLHDEKEYISEDDINRIKKVITDISRIDIQEAEIDRIMEIVALISKIDTRQNYINIRKELNQNISENEIKSMMKILTEISEDDISEVDIYSMQKVVHVVKKIKPNEIKNWKKTNTYLTEGDIKSMKTFIDKNKEELMLTDAGIEFNSPYPLVLHPGRKMDLILSFEFSAPDPAELPEWPFSELRKAEKWAKCRNIPFPDLSMIDIYKKGAIENLYVFPGTCIAPTIMHFVMYNKGEHETREDCESKVNDMYFREYKTLNFWYYEEQFEWLSDLMKTIVEEKESQIKEQIAKAVELCISSRVEPAK